jgi:hypothetical protein
MLLPRAFDNLGCKVQRGSLVLGGSRTYLIIYISDVHYEMDIIAKIISQDPAKIVLGHVVSAGRDVRPAGNHSERYTNLA